MSRNATASIRTIYFTLYDCFAALLGFQPIFLVFFFSFWKIFCGKVWPQMEVYGLSQTNDPKIQMGCMETVSNTKKTNGFFLWRARQRKEALTWLSVFSDINVWIEILYFCYDTTMFSLALSPALNLIGLMSLVNWNWLTERHRPIYCLSPTAKQSHSPLASMLHALHSVDRPIRNRTEQDRAAHLSILSRPLTLSLSLSTRPSPSCPLSVHDFRRFFTLSVLQAVSMVGRVAVLL